LLKENSRGSISSMVKPETGQAKLEEKTVRSPLSAFSAMARPSASFSAVSSESASRLPRSGFTTMRSTTTSMSCLSFLSSAGVLDLVELAVDLDALEALRCSSASSLRYSPLRPRTMGASR
jgi:hypothetical protein